MRKPIDRIRGQLERGEAAVGAFLQLGSTGIVEIAGDAGFDFVVIDCEHGAFSFETAVQLIRAAEAADTMPMVRVSGAALKDLGRFLDAGAMGLLVPQVNSAEQARAVVAASKYRTARYADGMRGACPFIRATRYRAPTWPEHADWFNDNCPLWILVETAEGLDELPKILEVPGIDTVMFGTFDLAVAMGHDGDRNHPAVLGRMSGAIERVRSRGIEVACFLDDADPLAAAVQRQRLAAQGCRIFLAAVDARILSNAFRGLHAAARAASPSTS